MSAAGLRMWRLPTFTSVRRVPKTWCSTRISKAEQRLEQRSEGHTMKKKKVKSAPRSGSARDGNPRKAEAKKTSRCSARKAAFRAGDTIAEKISGQPGVIIADLEDNLTFEHGSYECDLGHGYFVVRHRSEIERRPLARNEKGQP